MYFLVWERSVLCSFFTRILLICINLFWNWFRFFSFFLSLSCDKPISFLICSISFCIFFCCVFAKIFFFFLYLLDEKNFYDYENFFKNYKIHILMYSYLLSFWSFANSKNTRETPCHHSVSRRGLVLYWDRISLKNSNLNGVFTASYWFWTSVFKSPMN